MNSRLKTVAAVGLLLSTLVCVAPTVARSDTDYSQAVLTLQNSSTGYPVIYLVGQNGGQADPIGQFQIAALLNGGPIPGATITIDFSSCPDDHIALFQPYLGLSVNCQKVSAVTNSQGLATFRIVGSAHNTGPASACSLNQGATVYIFGIPRAIYKVACFDQDGAGGVGANDLSLWLGDWGSGQYCMRSDYNGDGVIGADDMSLWLGCLNGGGSAVSGGTSCP